MKIGNVVEYIDQQKIICAVIIHENKGKLKLLNENNREVSFSQKRLTHTSELRLDLSTPRDSLASQLKELAQKRQKYAETIDIKELWEILYEESGQIDLQTMTCFCFDPPQTSDHESAVIRAFFADRLYFKFNNQIFDPFSPDQVKAKKKQIKKAEKTERMVQQGTAWVNDTLNDKNSSSAKTDTEIIQILKDYFLFGNDSQTSQIGKQIIKRSTLNSAEQLFTAFVKTGVFNQNENIELLSLQIPTDFSKSVRKQENELAAQKLSFLDDPLRQDLTSLKIITIDGQSTLDFDDAISLENTDTGYTLGIHIIDVDAYVKSESPIDLSARERASSIYMPDDKLPMIPPGLSEDLCSLKENKVRPGISTLIKMNRFFEIQDYSIVPSIIKVHKQMSYTEANLLNGKDDPVTTLYKIATTLREKRLKAGAIQITLPEVNIWLEENGEIGYSKVDRENPSRMLVSEMMIAANALMAEFLSNNNMPAVFRSQAAPKERLFSGIETSLTMNFMQRKHLSRAIIGTKPEMHAGLGLKSYVTATSPIRRYHDLLTQRQIKAIFGYHKPYTRNELEEILQLISQPLANTGRIQASRKRYWIIKYLEAMRGNTYEALVLDCYRDHYNVLLKEFMLETKLPSSGIKLKYGDVIQVTIQHADARRDQLSLFV